MNRRDFLKISSTFAAGAFASPFLKLLERKENMLGDTIGKFLRGKPVTESEIQDVERLLNETQLRNAIQSGLVNDDGSLKQYAPILTIYSETLEVNASSVTVQLPDGYRHLWIMGQGRVTSANGGNVWCQFNGDTTNSYSWTLLSGNGTAASSSADTSDPYAALGLFSNTGDPAGSASSFDARIVNFSAPYHKAVLANTYYNDNTSRVVYSIGSKWSNISPIASMEIFATDNTLVKGSTSMAAGTVLSVYAIR